METKTQDYEPTHLKRWERANNYIGEDLSDHYVVTTKSPQSQLLTQANWKVYTEELQDYGGVKNARFGHWASGHVRMLLIHKDSTEALKRADELKKRYNEYPVLDEGLYHEMEHNRIIEYIKTECRCDDDKAHDILRWVENHDNTAICWGEGWIDIDTLEEAQENV